MRVSIISALVICCVGVVAAQADLIGLEPDPPQLSASDLHVQYKAHDGTLDAWTKPNTDISYSPDGVSWFEGTGSLSLTMEVNPEDGTLISGSLTMTTYTGEAGFAEGTTTTAELRDFGYDFNTGEMDLKFINAAGSPEDNPFVNAVTTPLGAINVVLTLGEIDSNPWPVDFTKSWSNQGKGTIAAGVPEPSTIGLLALGALAVIRRRRRRRAR